MSWSRSVYEASLCTFVLRSETMIWSVVWGFDISLQSFKKPSVNVFSLQIDKKTFDRVFSYNFGCRKKALSDFLASSSSLKTVNTRKPAKSFKLKLKGPRGFRPFDFDSKLKIENQKFTIAIFNGWFLKNWKSQIYNLNCQFLFLRNKIEKQFSMFWKSKIENWKSWVGGFYFLFLRKMKTKR